MKGKNEFLLQPPAKLGFIGGGQLGRMMAQEAKRMGYHVTVLDPTPQCPAAQVCDQQIVASFSDSNALRKLAENTDVVTYEFEHINADILCTLGEEGFRVIPSGHTLKKIQNKYIQKSFLRDAGVPVPRFSMVKSRESLLKAASELGLPLVLKTCYGGYDGKGSLILRHLGNIEDAMELINKTEVMAEEFVKFRCELSIIISKSVAGETVLYPVVENTHRDNILHLTRVPAGIDPGVEQKVKSIAKKVLDALDDIGVFCIEMFLDQDSRVYINEIAPRPHNSGHYTIEGCVTSQFEQLVRIIAGMPLGSSRLYSPCAMVNILGSQDVEGSYTFEGVEKILGEEEVYLHLYGKHFTAKSKKIGHITVCDASLDVAEKKALTALENIRFKSV